MTIEGLGGLSGEAGSRKRKRDPSDNFVIGRLKDEERWGDEDWEEESSESSDDEDISDESSGGSAENSSDEDADDELSLGDESIADDTLNPSEDSNESTSADQADDDVADLRSRLRNRKPINYFPDLDMIDVFKDDFDVSGTAQVQATATERRRNSANVTTSSNDYRLSVNDIDHTDDEEDGIKSEKLTSESLPHELGQLPEDLLCTLQSKPRLTSKSNSLCVKMVGRAREQELRTLEHTESLIGEEYSVIEGHRKDLSTFLAIADVELHDNQEYVIKRLETFIRDQTLALRVTEADILEKVKDRILNNLSLVDPAQQDQLKRLCYSDAGDSTDRNILFILVQMDYLDRELSLGDHTKRQ